MTGAQDELLAAQVLAGFAWPELPPQLTERRRLAAVPSSSSSSEHPDSDRDDAGFRPRKVRVLPSSVGSSSQLLTRRTYTWRGICCRRAEKQQRQLEALRHQQLPQAAAPSLPAHSSGTDSAPGCPAPTAAEGQTQKAAAAPSSAAAAGGGREGERDWAALTTWLRMNIHNPRTAKRVVQFLGRRDAATGRWAFELNPALRWADLSPDTRHRLQHLPAEAAKAFAAKYPGRSAEAWRQKTQRYRPPGPGARAHLLLLEDLVLGLHSVWRQHEGGSSSSAGGSAGAARGACSTGSAGGRQAGVAAVDAQLLASCSSSSAAFLQPQ